MANERLAGGDVVQERSVYCDECGIDMRPNLAVGRLGGRHKDGCSKMGVSLITRDDPRYCPWARAGEEHRPHQHFYEYDRPEKHGGHTLGNAWCDGAPLQPYPSVAADDPAERPLWPE